MGLSCVGNPNKNRQKLKQVHFLQVPPPYLHQSKFIRLHVDQTVFFLLSILFNSIFIPLFFGHGDNAADNNKVVEHHTCLPCCAAAIRCWAGRFVETVIVFKLRRHNKNPDSNFDGTAAYCLNGKCSGSIIHLYKTLTTCLPLLASTRPPAESKLSVKLALNGLITELQAKTCV